MTWIHHVHSFNLSPKAIISYNSRPMEIMDDQLYARRCYCDALEGTFKRLNNDKGEL